MENQHIALLVLHEELDDVKSKLSEKGISIEEIESIESRLKNRLLGILSETEALYQEGKDLDKKSFALKYKHHPYFALAMFRYNGRVVDTSTIRDWYVTKHLQNDFSLNIVTGEYNNE